MNDLLREMCTLFNLLKGVALSYKLNARPGISLYGMTIPVGIIVSGICEIEFKSL